MTRNGWRKGLGDLARDVTGVLLVYALMLQMLTPAAFAQAEARDGLEKHAILCSAMAGAASENPGKAPTQVVHNCLSCCLAGAVAILTPPAQLPAPASYCLEVSPLAPTDLGTPSYRGGPPPQRAPPGIAWSPSRHAAASFIP